MLVLDAGGLAGIIGGGEVFTEVEMFFSLVVVSRSLLEVFGEVFRLRGG